MNKLKTLKNLILGGVAVALIMVLSMIPANVSKAAVTTPDWNSFKWEEVTYGKTIELENCGFYKNFTVPESNTVYYTKLGSGHYYFKIKGKNTISFNYNNSTSNITNALSQDSYATPYYTYLELKKKELSLIDGACVGNRILVTCGNTIYLIYPDNTSFSLTIHKASDTLCIVDVPDKRQIYIAPAKESEDGYSFGTDKSSLVAGGQKSYYISENFTYFADTAAQSTLKNEWDAVITKNIYKIAETGANAANEIKDLPNISEDLKKEEVSGNLVYRAHTIVSSAKTDSELTHGNAVASMIDAIKDLFIAASNNNAAIDNHTKLTAEEKAAMKKQVEDNTKAAIKAFNEIQATDEAIAATKSKGLSSIQSPLLEAEKNFTKAELDAKAQAEKDYIGTIKNLTDYEKRLYKENIDKIVKETKENIDNADSKTAIDAAMKTGTDNIDAEKTKADDKAKGYVLKVEQDSNNFIKDIMTDENGKPITNITEATLIKILLGEDRWNSLDQATKDYINQIIQKSGGVSYEVLLASAKKSSQTVADAGNNYDNGTIPLYASKVTANKTTLNWIKVDGADGYFVYANFCRSNEKKDKPKLVKDVPSSSTTYTINKRKKNKWYKYRVVAYKNINGRKTPISQSMLIHVCNAGKDYKYGNPAKVTVKKKSIKLAVNKTATIKAKVVMPKNKKYKKHTAKIRYITSDNNIVTVNNKGKITAKASGTCTIYVCAQNGIYKTVKVTVK